MRILIVQESDWLSKGPHDQHHLAEKVSLRGHEVRVIDFEVLWRMEDTRELRSGRKVFSGVSKIYDGGQVTVIRPAIVKARVPGIDYLSLAFSHQREINRQIKEFAPDIIVGLGILNNYLAVKSARANGIPFIHYWLDVMHTLIPFRCFRPVGKILEKRILRQATAVLATNKRLRARMIEMGADADKAYIIRHGIDFARFNPELVDGAKVRERWGIRPGDIVISYVGRLSRITGVREIPMALSKVDNHNLKFLVVGTGTRESELRQMRQKLGLQERMVITGRRPYDEVPGLIAASDICLLPYHSIEMTHDIVPLKIFDYMAMGKPVISTRLPGMVEEFGEGNGIVYIDRPEDVVQKSVELAAQGNLAELGVKARQFVFGNSWDSTTDELERILNWAIGKKGQNSS